MALAESQVRRHQLLAGLGIGVGCWIILSGVYLLGVFEPFDLRLLDLRFRLRGERPAGSHVALVSVDDATIRGYGAWPLPRESYALLIAALEAAGAKAIGVDLQFPSDRNQDPRSDELLARVSADHENVAHAIWFYAQGPASGTAPDWSASTREALAQQGIVGASVPAAVARGAALPFEELATSARRLGHITVAVDRDGTVRRVPLLVRYGDRVYPALALTLYSAEQGFSGGPALQPTAGGTRLVWPNGAQVFAPVDPQGSTAIDFAGEAGSFPFQYSMLQVLQWYQAGDSTRLRETFAGKTILIGLTSREEASADVGPTPFAATTPFVFVHANVLENLHHDRFLLRPGVGAYLGPLAVYAALLGVLLSLLALPVSAGIVALSTALMAAISQAALSWGSMDIPPLLCLIVGPVVYAATASHRYLFLERRSERREAEIREGLSVQQRFLPEALIGTKLSHYRIEERVGAGGMGVVYRARDERSGRDVALKVLPGGVLANEQARRRFRHEALALSKLHHPHIAALIDSDSQDGNDFIVMEFVHGKSLVERIRRGPLPEVEAVRIASQVCEALAEAHRSGILHRDLKPANVMLTETGEVKLLDFGLALLRGADSDTATVTGRLTESGHVVGTLSYMAPEALHGGTVDERTDVYGVGTLLFEMTTGRRPFPEDSPQEVVYMIVAQPPPRPSVLNGHITPAVERVILQCLSKRPEERPPSACAVLKALELRQSPVAP